jgi:hypothetical protein
LEGGGVGTGMNSLVAMVLVVVVVVLLLFKIFDGFCFVFPPSTTIHGGQQLVLVNSCGNNWF